MFKFDVLTKDAFHLVTQVETNIVLFSLMFDLDVQW